MSENIASSWRVKHQRYRLQGEECPHCSYKIFPPRDICPECGQPAKEPYQLSGRGEVYSFTTVKNAPADFAAYVPYTIALVKLEEGPTVTAQLTDVRPSDVEIGMPVEMVTRKIRAQGDEGTIIYGYKFRPLLKQG